MATAAQVQIKPGKLFIGGMWVDAASGKTFRRSTLPRGEFLTHIAEGDGRDADAAVLAASKAVRDGPWAEVSATDRGKNILENRQPHRQI